MGEVVLVDKSPAVYGERQERQSALSTSECASAASTYLSIFHAAICVSFHLMHIKKNHMSHGITKPVVVGSGEGTEVAMGIRKPATADELDGMYEVELDGVLAVDGVYVVSSPSASVMTTGVDKPVGIVIAPPLLEMTVSPEASMVVISDAFDVIGV